MLSGLILIVRARCLDAIHNLTTPELQLQNIMINKKWREKNTVIIYCSPVEKTLFEVFEIATGFPQRHCPAFLFQEGQCAAGRRLSSWVKTGFWEVGSSYLQSHSCQPTRANKRPRIPSFTVSYTHRSKSGFLCSLLEVCDLNTSGVSQSNMLVRINTSFYLCGTSRATDNVHYAHMSVLSEGGGTCYVYTFHTHVPINFCLRYSCHLHRLCVFELVCACARQRYTCGCLHFSWLALSLLTTVSRLSARSAGGTQCPPEFMSQTLLCHLSSLFKEAPLTAQDI